MQKTKLEARKLASPQLDTMSALEIATLMNREDAKIAAAVKKALPQIAQAIDLVVQQLAKGGRLIYVGAGTSGRIAALDASECPPTFNSDPEMVQYVIAGGDRALSKAAEAKEDSTELARRDLSARRLTKRDVVVGLAASGRTPYTVAAVEYARERGIATIAVTCQLKTPISQAADIAIEVNVGPEVLAGSTRLKAGTAEKMVCNMLTTGAMARLGYVYGSLMVNLQTKNSKLLERGIEILIEAGDTDRESAITALRAARMEVPVALVMLRAAVSRSQAVARLKKANRSVRKAIGSED